MMDINNGWELYCGPMDIHKKKVPRKIIVVNDIPMISTIFSVLMFDIPIMDHLLGRTFFPYGSYPHPLGNDHDIWVKTLVDGIQE